MSTVHDGPPGPRPVELAQIDMNLLVAFDALARERNVTRAAQRLGVTQSALSHALRRLRELLRDPLLVRGRGGMVLTPRADALVIPLRSGLLTLGRALTEPITFEPRSARRAFRVATPDLFDVLVLPPLLARIGDQAPGIDLAVVPVDERQLLDQLETGEVDAAVVPELDGARTVREPLSGPGLVRRIVFRDRFVCLLRAAHPALQASGRAAGGSRKTTRAQPSAAPRKLTLQTYAGLSHLLVTVEGTGRGMVDQRLAERGLTRRIALRVPAFYSALRIIARSDLILTAPSALARLASADEPVLALPAPLALPTHSVNLIWHERFTKDPAHEWLRTQLVACALQAVES